jgi:hypothetical protein
MGLKFYEGFDFAANSENPDYLWSILDWNGGTNPGIYVTGRINGRAINNTQYARRSLGENCAGLVVGIAFKRQDANWPSGGDTAMNFIQFIDQTTRQIEVRLLRGAVSGFKFQIFRGATMLADSGDLAISTGTWYYLEAKAVLHGSLGSIEVRLNGVAVPNLTLSGINTISTVNEYANIVGFASGSQGGSYGTHIDDAYCCDLLGSGPMNNFLGDVHVETLALNGDVTKAWTPSTGTTNYTVLDDIPMLASDWVSSSVIGQTDEYAVASLSNVPAQIFAVGILQNIDKDDAGYRTSKAVVVSGGATADGTPRNPDMNLRRTYQDYFVVDPATGLAWSAAGVNNMNVRILPVA